MAPKKSTSASQSDLNSARNSVKDPYNKYFWRQNVKRLEFEAIRDSILAIGGDLDRKSFGIPTGMNSYRRSIYNYVDRNGLEETMFAFDMANPDLPTGKRAATTVPTQALYLMNNDFFLLQAKAIAQTAVSLIKDKGSPELQAELEKRISQAKHGGSNKQREISEQEREKDAGIQICKHFLLWFRINLFLFHFCHWIYFRREQTI